MHSIHVSCKMYLCAPDKFMQQTQGSEPMFFNRPTLKQHLINVLCLSCRELGINCHDIAISLATNVRISHVLVDLCLYQNDIHGENGAFGLYALK